MRKHNTHPLTLVLYGPSRRVMFNVFQDISRSWLPAKVALPLSLSLAFSIVFTLVNISHSSIQAGVIFWDTARYWNKILEVWKPRAFLDLNDLICKSFPNPSDFRLSLSLCVPTESTGSTVPQEFWRCAFGEGQDGPRWAKGKICLHPSASTYFYRRLEIRDLEGLLSQSSTNAGLYNAAILKVRPFTGNIIQQTV